MDETPDEIIKNALQECLNDGLDASVYNDSINDLIYKEHIKEFSSLEISSLYMELKESSGIPKWFDFKLPNASKYVVMNYDVSETGDRLKSMWMMDDEERAEAAVRILKKIHNIKDPWDDNPDWFKTHKPGDEL